MWAIIAATAAYAVTAVIPVPIDTAIVVDGSIVEAAWAEATPIADFTSFQPSAGERDAGTEARILFDERALYVSFIVRTRPGRTLNDPLVPRDEIRGHDFVGILIDTYQDGRRAFDFRVNPRGVQSDGIYVEGDSLFSPQTSWDTVFESASRITEDGYTVEIAIPMRSLRYPNTEAQTWGIVLLEFAPRPSTLYTWPPLSQDESGVLVQAADLGPFDAHRPRVQLEVQPTLTSTVDVGASTEARLFDPGLNLRSLVTPSHIVDLTFNPDFSQIEADVDRVTANVKYPLYYAEKRPFFLEGADLFARGDALFYSRSIVDPLVGYKVTGRGNGVSMGLTGAWDEHPAASTVVMDYASNKLLPGWGPELTERARALDHVAAAEVEIGHGDSVGLFVSDKELFLDDSSRLGHHLAGVDTRVQGGRMSLSAAFMASHTDLEDGTSLAGPAWHARADRHGESFSAWFEHRYRSPEFRVENGFVTEVGRAELSGGVNQSVFGVGPIRSANASLAASTAIADTGVVGMSVGPSLDAMLGDRVYAQTSFSVERERFAAVDFDLWTSDGYVSVTPTAHTYVGVGFELGPMPHYFATTEQELYRGFDWGAIVMAGGSFADRLRVAYEGTVETFNETAWADPVYTTVLHRGEVNLNLSRKLSVRSVEQWDGYSRELMSSALVGYESNYGTGLFVGYTNLARDEGTQHTAFAKLTYLWRP